jgi:hypothetical protein
MWINGENFGLMISKKPEIFGSVEETVDLWTKF